MKEGNSNFFDVRTILAIAAVMFTFVGWQAYLQKKYPDAYKRKDQSVAPAPSQSGSSPSTTKLAEKGASERASELKAAKERDGLASAGAQAPQAEQLFPFESGKLAFSLSSKGMGLRNIRVPEYKDRKGGTVALGQPEDGLSPLETRITGRSEALDFNVKQVNPNLFTGQAAFGGVKITKTVEIFPDQYLLKVRVMASGQDPRFVGLSTSLVEAVGDLEKGTDQTFPQLEKQEFYLDTAEGRDRVPFKAEDSSRHWARVKLASIGSQYFTQAIIDGSQVMPEARGEVEYSRQSARLSLQYPVLNPGQDFQLEYSAYVGPKAFGVLHKIDSNLAAVVDFGTFSWIGRYIFALLQWLYSLVGNWGLAIICLTLMVRLLVLPFNIYSYKSMKAMQAIQPQLKALRERYKDDQQTQQAETMRLMKENKVNPLGGCLPLLLQMPVFFALYQVLGHSIDLYQAPFGLWIHDLSLKDPYYILPVLMGITMFVQQKTTPNASMDPAQAKVLMYMPLLFTGFMVTLPSGLTLYMLVGAVFSVAQQTYFMKRSNSVPTDV